MKRKLAQFILSMAVMIAISLSAASAKTSHSHSYEKIINEMARKHHVPVALAHAIIRVESNYNARAHGRAGEIGLMQIKPATARHMGYSGSDRALYNPRTNLEYGMKYLSKAHHLSGGNLCRTILKYNAGHSAKQMNPTSARYCSRVKNYMKLGNFARNA